LLAAKADKPSRTTASNSNQTVLATALHCFSSPKRLKAHVLVLHASCRQLHGRYTKG
jgi:hypothetical protein